MRTVRTIIPIAVAALVVGLSPAASSAAVTPTIATTKPYVTQGGLMQVTGTGCTGSTMASVSYVSDPGEPEENVFSTDFPVAVDGTGAFASTTKTVPAALPVGTAIEVHGACDSPFGTPTNDLELRVAAVPTAPSGVTGTPGNGQVSLSWTASTANWAPITGYTVTPYIGATAQPQRIFPGTATSQVITGLTNGTAHTFKVLAQSQVGSSPQSAASAAVTPAAPTTVPGAPTGVSATAGQAKATVSWTAPAAPGSSAITGYVITPVVSGVAQAPVASAGTGATKVVTGLTNGLSTRFRVAATNAAGTGPDSAATSPILTPWGSYAATVASLFQRFAGRAPTSAESSAAVGRLQSGTSVGMLVTDLRRNTNGVSADALTKVDPNVRLYFAYFLRIPDPGGLGYWLGRSRSGTPLSTISSTFAGSNEFKTRYGSLTNRGFVELVYENVLGRPGEESGISYWTGKLDTKARSRGQVMVGFSESSEYRGKKAAAVDVAYSWIALTGKAPTPAQFAPWEADLKAGTKTIAALTAAILGTDTVRA
jgi:hypothetical protein